MTLFYQEVAKIGILLAFSIFLASFILFLSLRVSAANPDTEKLSAYECGFDPYEDARNVFDVRFYLVAILFIIFDIEIMFLMPWVAVLGNHTLVGFLSMFFFLFILTVGFIYE